MSDRICCIFNTPSLYRKLIYRRIDETFECDWYFEDTDNQLKEFSIDELKHAERRHAFKIGPFYWVKGIISLLKNRNYSHYLMMGHSRNLTTLVFLFIKNIMYREKKVYLWTHGYYGKESLVERIYKKILFKSSDALLVYGDYACKLMEKDGFSSSILYPIHNSLDYDTQKKLRNELVSSSIYFDHFKNRFPTIIFIGRLNPVKRLDMLIRSVAALNADGRRCNLVIVGDGPEMANLTNLVNHHGIEKSVWFYGACYDEKENAELIYNADLCVAPGNIGLTAMHVMMFGCPAISHNKFPYQMPEFEAISDGQTGTFYEYGSQDSLTESIWRWFTTENYDREAIRQNCFGEIDRNWNPEYQIEILKSVIR